MDTAQQATTASFETSLVNARTAALTTDDDSDDNTAAPTGNAPAPKALENKSYNLSKMAIIVPSVLTVAALIYGILFGVGSWQANSWNMKKAFLDYCNAHKGSRSIWTTMPTGVTNYGTGKLDRTLTARVR